MAQTALQIEGRTRSAILGRFETKAERAYIPIILTQAVEELQVGITITDTSGTILYVNPAEAKMHGYTVEELQGLHTRDLSPPEDRKPLTEEQLTTLRKWRRERIRIRKDGTAFPARLLSDVVRDASGHVVGMITICEDISEQARARAAVQRQNQELEMRVLERTEELAQTNQRLEKEIQDRMQLIEELNSFAHTVAHDLKSPLAVLLGYAGYLQDHRETISPEELGHHLDTVVKSGEKMKSIIEEILLLACIPRMQVKLEPLNMSDILRNVRQLLVPHRKDLTLMVPVHWPDVMGHPGWVERVWTNLISNAIKYGGKPPVVILRCQEEPEGMVRFSVSDNGPGLPEDDQQKLFKQFSRLDSTSKETDGHGLGLSIVSHIVQKLGGTVGMESEPGKGSTFFFTLPAAPRS